MENAMVSHGIQSGATEVTGESEKQNAPAPNRPSDSGKNTTILHVPFC